MSDTDFSFLSVRELGDRVRTGRVRPTVLAEYFLDRLERLGPRYNAVVTVMRERALEEARAAERDIADRRWRGPLHGIPYGVKDLLAARGAPTTWGAAPYREQRFDFDGTVVERLREAGAVLVAKLAMVELAGGMGYNHADASFTGPGLNPWNTGFWSGGSSSGPGSAVAAGLVPFAIGSETSGSILTPASYCGVTGLRPTYGRVSRHGAMSLCWTLDKLGPMTRSAEDASLVLEAIAGRDERDASSVDRPYRHQDAGLAGRRPRLAVPKGVNDKEQPAVRENFLASLDVLRGFADVELEVEWPDLPWGPAVSAIVNAEGASAFRELIERGGLKELRCPADRSRGYQGMFTFAVDYLHAMRLRAPMKRAVAKLFERYDAVVSPARASVAIPADLEFEKAYPGVSGGPPLIPAGNLCGLPALCMPNGFGENGLPTSLALMGPAFSEERLVAVGREYQRASEWHNERPTGG
jgi:aspartyl-tRNA(Asn)/glutamyl-tRNA(Gln) amidotransferase subunit A